MRLQFDASTVPLDAVQRAAYALADMASATVQADADAGLWVCELFPHTDDPNKPNEEDLAHRMRTQVVDETLRLRIGAETEAVRNLVFALAFSRTGLVADA